MSDKQLEQLVEYIEDFDSSGIKLVFLSAPLRSGLYLVHSLVDNHPQILQFPQAVPVLYDWDRKMRYATPDNIVDQLFDAGFQIRQHRSHLGSDKSDTLHQDLSAIRALMHQLVPRLSKVGPREVLLAFYFSYA